MENTQVSQTFWFQLTGSAINKFLFWALALLSVVAGCYALTGFDQPVDRLSAKLIFAVAFALWCVNILITWLHGEKQSKRDDLSLTQLDITLIAVAVLGLPAAALLFSPWAYLAAVLGTVWVAAIRQPDTKLVAWNPMEATPRSWGLAAAAAFTVAFGLGVVAALAF